MTFWQCPKLKSGYCRGTAFLEIMLVCSVLAGIIMAVTMGVHTLSKVSMAGEAGIRAADVQMSTLLASLEKDFAYSDYVVMLKDYKTSLVPTNNPWGNDNYFNLSTIAPGFVQRSTPDKTNEDYRLILDARGYMTVSTAPQNTHSELHFIRGQEILAVLVVEWVPVTGSGGTLKLTRYTKSAPGTPTTMQGLEIFSPQITPPVSSTGNPALSGWVYEVPVVASNGALTSYIVLTVPNVGAFRSTWAAAGNTGLTFKTVTPGTTSGVDRWNLETKSFSGPSYARLARSKSKL